MAWITNPITEQFVAQGWALGVSEAELLRCERCAQYVGPRTTLWNSDAYRHIWICALERAKHGRPLLPDTGDVFAKELLGMMMDCVPGFYVVMQYSSVRAPIRDAYNAFLDKPTL